MSAEALLSAGKVASFRMQVSRTTRKVGPDASQRPCASLRFDERNRLGFAHGLAAVLAVRTGQCRGQLDRTTLPPTTAVACITSAYAKAATDTSDPTHACPHGCTSFVRTK